MTTDPTIEIRPFRRDRDGEAVIGLLHDLNRHEAALGIARDTRRDGAAACLDDDIRKARLWGGELHVATCDEAVIGYIALTLGKGGPFVPADIRDHVYVENLVVSEAFRRRGVGKALLAHAEDLARLHGFRSICLGVVPGNAPAEATYRQAGFQPTAI